MVYTIYRTLNLVNGKIYIGKHQTDDPYDDYLGSGKALKAAIKMYGISNFKKEVLHIFNTEEEMNVCERELLTEEFILSSTNYNSAVGGEGGPHFKGRHHSIEARKKISSVAKTRVISTSARKKISEANRHRTISLETRAKLSNSAKRRKLSLETIEKISNSTKRYFERLKSTDNIANPTI